MLDQFFAVANVVVPVFVLVGIGWLTVRAGLLKESIADGLSDFVFTIAIPVLLFRTLATAVIPDVSPIPFWASYFAAVAIVWTISSLMIRRVFGRDARAGVIAGVSATFSNNVLVALPVVVIAYGEAGAIPMVVLLAIHLPIMMTAGTILVERAERRDNPNAVPLSIGKVLLSIGRNLIRNPIVIGIVAGILWRSTSLPFEGVPRSVADMLAAAGVPCALFALGMSLRKFGLRGNVRPSLLIAALKLGALPALVWAFTSQVMQMPPLWVGVATIAAACPTGVNAWLIANRFNTGHAIAANTITITTGLAVLTMTLWLVVLT